MTEQYCNYEDILKDVCEKVYCYKEFGSYQGDWWSKVKYNSKVTWIKGCYGSCSGCDWLQGEMNYYGGVSDKETQKENERIKTAFINKYLDESMFYTQEKAEEEAEKNISWDCDAEEMLEFIKKYKYVGDDIDLDQEIKNVEVSLNSKLLDLEDCKPVVVLKIMSEAFDMQQQLIELLKKKIEIMNKPQVLLNKNKWEDVKEVVKVLDEVSSKVSLLPDMVLNKFAPKQ